MLMRTGGAQVQAGKLSQSAVIESVRAEKMKAKNRKNGNSAPAPSIDAGGGAGGKQVDSLVREHLQQQDGKLEVRFFSVCCSLPIVHAAFAFTATITFGFGATGRNTRRADWTAATQLRKSSLKCES